MNKGVEKLKAGIVYCHKCGLVKTVNSSECIKYGWPVCCGQTMSLDSTEELGIKVNKEPKKVVEFVWMIKYKVTKDCIDYGQRDWGFIWQIFETKKEALVAKSKHWDKKTLKVVQVEIKEK